MGGFEPPTVAGEHSPVGGSLPLLTSALLEAAEIVRDAEASPHPNRIRHMKTAAKAVGALAALIVSSAGAAVGWIRPVSQVIQAIDVAREAMGYATGKDCYFGAGCVYKATVTECVGCCGDHCGGGLYTDCVRMCLGQDPETAIRRVQSAAERLQDNAFTPAELPDLVKTVEAGFDYPDQLVRDVATAMAGETPFVVIRVAGHAG